MYGICNGFRDSDFNLGFDERRGRGDRGNPNLDPEMDIQQNREFYMHNDVRPPYTYAALIRYVSYITVVENSRKSLILCLKKMGKTLLKAI